MSSVVPANVAPITSTAQPNTMGSPASEYWSDSAWSALYVGAEIPKKPVGCVSVCTAK
ncbi:hypothetical protein JG687_00011466 [Phytophthora cactorum]|uniref:Uncharacterized protein n=1 Tax=Phytophthora cactorum TaxID=29920 RepID=A0A329SD41_9STRA|nr:hypothetical protein Pcac1_g16113 [Phytophthora cactorum]KAG2834125.1 hypothetical protein PC111_g5959 [Phytophthora cactorum]KAG2848185.1 hypothetical protein PC112_g844 [Phytophthora cactorum]KAG2868497.1 hypothetical protein PC113_g1029 [Phytophthora cactorum]KAG2935210.1 hypothetical protein PC114_g624 [Phytophthora cactorum]